MVVPSTSRLRSGPLISSRLAELQPLAHRDRHAQPDRDVDVRVPVGGEDHRARAGPALVRRGGERLERVEEALGQRLAGDHRGGEHQVVRGAADRVGGDVVLEREIVRGGLAASSAWVAVRSSSLMIPCARDTVSGTPSIEDVSSRGSASRFSLSTDSTGCTSKSPPAPTARRRTCGPARPAPAASPPRPRRRGRCRGSTRAAPRASPPTGTGGRAPATPRSAASRRCSPRRSPRR